MRAIPSAGCEIVDTASGKSGPVGPAQPATASISSEVTHLSVRAITAFLSSRMLRLIVAQTRAFGPRFRGRHQRGRRIGTGRCADLLLNIAHGGELVLRLRRIDDHHNESVAREIAV